MRPTIHTEPQPGWLLLWLPLVLIVFWSSSDPGSAMLRLAGVLLLGMVAWGAGLGPAGDWAERGFAALLLVAWFAVCGTAFRVHGVPSSVEGRLAFTAALLLGPVVMLWAWRRRAHLEPVMGATGGPVEEGSAGPLARGLALAGAALFALDRLAGLERSDLLVAGAGLALFAAFRVRGRERVLRVPGIPGAGSGR